jgi:carboxypeptidase Taq
MKSYDKLKEHFEKLSHLYYIQRILTWDESVMMPKGAGEYRAQAMATYNQIIQGSIATKNMGSLIQAAKSEKLQNDWDKANLRWMERKYIAASCIPTKLTKQWTRASLAAFQAWREYRGTNNWKDFAPYLEKAFLLAKEIATRKSQVLQLSPYEVSVDDFTPGLRLKDLDKIVSVLKEKLPPIRKKIIQKQSSQNLNKLRVQMPVEKQKQFALMAMQAMQFDFNSGRLDVSHHPFCDGVTNDIRITTRYNEENLLESIFAVIHETGHALYEQGMPLLWKTQPIGQTQDKALHESLALLYEYEVCHDRNFFEWLVEKISQISDSNQKMDANRLYNLAAQVKTNLIRVDADEVSYPLHVILRYEIERDLFEEEITVRDLPDVWNEKMLKYFNVSTDGNDKDGVMQDMHWVFGYFGYFPSYVVGQLMAAQIYDSFTRENQHFYQDLKSGNLSSLHNWLTKNIYSYGSSKSGEELLCMISGEPLNPDYFLNRIKLRYLEDVA